MLGKRPPTQPRRAPAYGRRPSGGTPAWLVFLLGVAVVFGGYYLAQGVQTFSLTTGAAGEATRAAATMTAIAEGSRPRVTPVAGGGGGGSSAANANNPDMSNDPVAPQAAVQSAVTFTPVPECQDFIIVERANIRDAPNTDAGVIEVYEPGTTLCVIGVAEDNPDWYLIDYNPLTRRVVPVYVYGTLVRALNPTATPTRTFTPAPTVTPMPSLTPSITPTPRPTQTPDPEATDTPTPTPTITPTVIYQSA